MSITVTLDDDVATWASARAAERHISVSCYVGEALRETMTHESSYERAMLEYLSEPPWPMPDDPTAPLPRREDVYDRPGVR
jgi:hypothetical protein